MYIDPNKKGVVTKSILAALSKSFVINESECKCFSEKDYNKKEL